MLHLVVSKVDRIFCACMLQSVVAARGHEGSCGVQTPCGVGRGHRRRVGSGGFADVAWGQAIREVQAWQTEQSRVSRLPGTNHALIILSLYQVKTLEVLNTSVPPVSATGN
jgi:hypothetical protein